MSNIFIFPTSVEEVGTRLNEIIKITPQDKQTIICRTADLEKELKELQNENSGTDNGIKSDKEWDLIEEIGALEACILVAAGFGFRS